MGLDPLELMRSYNEHLGSAMRARRAEASDGMVQLGTSISGKIAKMMS